MCDVYNLRMCSTYTIYFPPFALILVYIAHRQVHAAAAGVERPAGATPPRSPPCMAEQRRGRRCAGAACLGAGPPSSSPGARRRPCEEASCCVRGPCRLRRGGWPRRRRRRTGPRAQALADTMIEIEHDLFTLLVWPLISCSRPTEPMDGYGRDPPM